MLSIIIPSHNSLDLLKLTLQALSLQTGMKPTDFEVIVADDGSTDGTREYCLAYQGLDLIHLDLKRGLGNPGYGRNAGLVEARGDLFVFLDAGILPAPTYLSQIQSTYAGVRKTLVAHDILGIFTSRSDRSDQTVADLLSHYRSPKTCQALLEQLRIDPDWQDPRREVLYGLKFKAAQDPDQYKLSAPWAYVWSGSLVCSRDIVDHRVRFGPNFIGWGSEDQAFAFECLKEGYSLSYDPDLLTLHVPHKIETSQGQRDTAMSNRRILYQHYPCLELEIFAHTYSTHMEPLLAYCDSLIFSYVLPSYEETLLLEIKKWLTQSSKAEAWEKGPSLAIGWSAGEDLKKLGVSHALYLNDRQERRLSLEAPGITKMNSMGLMTPFEDYSFAYLVLNDYVRLLPQEFLNPFFHEILRLTKTIFFITDRSHQPYGSSVYGLNWHSLATCIEASPHPLTPQRIAQVGSQSLWLLVMDAT